MTLPGKMAGVLAVLLILNAAPSARAQEIDTSPQGQINDLRKEVAALKLRLLDAKVSELEMKKRLERLEDRIARLDGQSTPRSSFSFDPNPRTGTIRIQNDLDVPATVTIDGVAYLVRPGRTRLLTARPAGSIRYYVTADGFGVGSVKRSMVRADETLTITVYDTRLQRDLDQ